MGAYEHWPYSNLHDLNLDWVLQVIGDFRRQYQDLNEYFAGLIQQLDDKTEEEIAQYNQAVEDANANLNTAVEEMIAEVNSAKDDAITALTNTRNTYISSLQTIGNDQAAMIRNVGQEVVNTIPPDYQTLQNGAIKNIGNGAPSADPPEPVITDLNDVYYTQQNAMYNFHPGYTYTNTPAGSMSSNDYHMKMITTKDIYTYTGASDVTQSCMQIFFAIKYNDPTQTIVFARSVYITYTGGVVTVTALAWHLI